MKQLFYLRPTWKDHEIRFQPLLPYDEHALKKGLNQPSPSLPVKIVGKTWCEIVSLTDPFNFAVSERILNVLQQAKLTGWKSYPIDIEGQSEKYFGLQIVGTCGPVVRPREAGFVTGFEFDHSTWDGSDFFCPRDTFTVFCTEKANVVLTSSKLKNLVIEDISTVEWYNA